MNVKVYSTPTCPWCTRVKEFLKSNKVVFEDINVSGDQEASQAMIKASKQMGVPVIIADDIVIVGFDEERLREVLGL